MQRDALSEAQNVPRGVEVGAEWRIFTHPHEFTSRLKANITSHFPTKSFWCLNLTKHRPCASGEAVRGANLCVLPGGLQHNVSFVCWSEEALPGGRPQVPRPVTVGPGLLT